MTTSRLKMPSLELSDLLFGDPSAIARNGGEWSLRETRLLGVKTIAVKGVAGRAMYRTLASRLFAHEGAKLVILAIVDSPGGSSGGLWQLTEAIRSVSSTTPVIAYAKRRAVGPLYLAGLACRALVARATARVGIGKPFSAVCARQLMDWAEGEAWKLQPELIGSAAGIFGGEQAEARGMVAAVRGGARRAM